MKPKSTDQKRCPDAPVVQIHDLKLTELEKIVGAGSGTGKPPVQGTQAMADGTDVGCC